MGSSVKQQGYLLIIATILLVLFSAVGAVLAVNYIKKGKVVAQEQSSQQALYIAQSALSMARRALLQQTTTCATISGSGPFTQVGLLGGQMSVTGTEYVAESVLASPMSAQSTSITLDDASQFGPSGIITIGSEIISYKQHLGNTLSQLVRGLDQSSASSHAVMDVVKQDQCQLQATGAMPSFANVKGKHTLQEIMIKKLFNFPFDTPTILSASEITLRGNSSITNSGVIYGSSSYPGSTMVSGQNITIQGAAKTQVINSQGEIVTSSTASNIQQDLTENLIEINSSNLASYYFNVPLTTMFGIADHGFSASNINGVKNKVIWIDQDLTLNGNGSYEIGSTDEPVILIVNGDLKVTGRPTIYLNGLLYVTGNIDITGNADIVGNATIASEGSGDINSEVDLGGNMRINLNPTDLKQLANLTPYINNGYQSKPLFLHEVQV